MGTGEKYLPAKTLLTHCEEGEMEGGGELEKLLHLLRAAGAGQSGGWLGAAMSRGGILRCPTAPCAVPSPVPHPTWKRSQGPWCFPQNRAWVLQPPHEMRGAGSRCRARSLAWVSLEAGAAWLGKHSGNLGYLHPGCFPPGRRAGSSPGAWGHQTQTLCLWPAVRPAPGSPWDARLLTRGHSSGF